MLRVAPYSRTLVSADATAGFNVLWLPSGDEWTYTSGLTKPYKSISGVPGIKVVSVVVSCADSAGNRRKGYIPEVEIFSEDSHTVYKLRMPVAIHGYASIWNGEIDCPYGLCVTIMSGSLESGDSFGITVGVKNV